MTLLPAAPDGEPTEEAGDIQFAVFSAGNEAAIHLLETIACKVSPPALKSDENTFGYQLSIPPSCDSFNSGRFRWRIGAGPSPALIEKGLCFCEPDILLCPLDIHATIHTHPRSGVILITTHSSRPIVYEKGDVDDGDLILDASPRRNTCWPSQLLNFIPKSHSETSWNVWLHQKIPNSSITSGVDIHTGWPVAVKRLETRAKGRQHMRRRLQIACQYKDRLHKGILGVIDIWCGHKSPFPCLFSKQSESNSRCLHTFYSEPLAEHNFLNAAISLHIRPLGKKPSASVCVAPEVWKSNKKDLDYLKADIWSLAASWLFAFVRPPSGIRIIKESYHTLHKTLDSQNERGFIPDSFATLLRQMLAWDPKDRPSAEEALVHQAWVPVLAHGQLIADDRKRKRIEQTQNSSIQTRRARVLSPDVHD
ncbi:kinase-like domain-containing protein [Trichoderma austrokoningii]